MNKLFRGGFAVGNSKVFTIKGSWPFATLTVGDKLVLKTGLFIYTKTYTFEPSEILIKLRFNKFNIIHNEPNYPSLISFSPNKARDLYELLSSKDVFIEGKPNRILEIALRAFCVLFCTFFCLILSTFIIGYCISIFKS